MSLVGLAVLAGVVVALAGYFVRASQVSVAGQRALRGSRNAHQQLSTFCHELNGVLNRRDLEQGAVHLIASALGATEARLYTLDRETRRYSYRAGTGGRFPTRAHGPTATSADEESVTALTDHEAWGDTPLPRRALTLPLHARSQPIGLLALGPKRSGAPYSREERALLDTLASQLAIALENATLYEEIRSLYLASVQSLAATVDAKDRYTHGHSVRVAHYAREIARALGLAAPELERIELAALLHDIGKIGVPDTILLKPDRLTADEWLVMVRHAQLGADILADNVALTPLVALVRHHHERYDGRGYPTGLAGDAIPVGAAIIAVADTYDTITTDRPYRAALLAEAARDEIVRCTGSQFSPAVVRAFLTATATPGWLPATLPGRGGDLAGTTDAPRARAKQPAADTARLQTAPYLQEFHYG